MRLLFILIAASLLSWSASCQSRNNIIYSSFVKFPNSSFDLCLGLDHAFKLTRRDYTSGRIYFVLSPNFLWSGYSFPSSGSDPSSTFNNYQLALPAHLRFELAPNRLILGTKPGKHNFNGAVFFDIGLSMNYMLAANLQEDFSQSTGNSYPFVFKGSLTSTAANRLSMNYLSYNIGMRINRLTFFFRIYQPFVTSKFKDLSSGWGLPPTVHSFFYSKWLTDPYYNQGTALLCLGYHF